MQYVFGDEVRCGYKLRIFSEFGGNSYGVCRGLDQGGKLTNKALIPRFFTCKLGFLYW